MLSGDTFSTGDSAIFSTHTPEITIPPVMALILKTERYSEHMLKILIIVVVMIAGCATSSKNMNRLRIGMSKAEVIHILDSPESTRASQEVEFLIFNLMERIAQPGEAIAPIPINNKYFVKLIDGKVESYGRIGDFNSTRGHEILD